MGAFDDWFEPKRMYASGYPAGISSAARESAVLREGVRQDLDALAPASVLEIGPGDASICEGRPGAVLMDLAIGFLRKLSGPRVCGDLFAAPFAPLTFDVVVAVDVLTHIRPAQRRRALECMAALGRDMIYLNPEPGAREVAESPVRQTLVRATFQDLGYKMNIRKYNARNEIGEHPVYLTTALRRA